MTRPHSVAHLGAVSKPTILCAVFGHWFRACWDECCDGLRWCRWCGRLEGRTDGCNAPEGHS